VPWYQPRWHFFVPLAFILISIAIVIFRHEIHPSAKFLLYPCFGAWVLVAGGLFAIASTLFREWYNIPNPSQDAKPDVKYDAQALPGMIQHEGNLINQRVTWLLQFNAFLIAGITFAWEKSTVLVLTLAVLGSLIAISAGNSMICAAIALKKLAKQNPGAIGLNLNSRLQEIALPWFVISPMLALAWMFIGLYSLPNGPLKELRTWDRHPPSTNYVAFVNADTNAIPIRMDLASLPPKLSTYTNMHAGVVIVTNYFTPSNQPYFTAIVTNVITNIIVQPVPPP